MLAKNTCRSLTEKPSQQSGMGSREEWISTTWDVPVNLLPDVVRERVQDSYPEYRIDDADYVETPAGDRYKLEIERGEWDRTIFVTPDGVILN